MSTSETIKVKCPRCGQEHEARVWKTLDVSAEPTIKEALFAWEINVFNCPGCDFRAQLPVSLLYTDPDKMFAVRYYPMDALGDEGFYAGFRHDGEPVEPEPSAIKPHVVFDMAEMMRYIVFREIAFVKGK